MTVSLKDQLLALGFKKTEPERTERRPDGRRDGKPAEGRRDGGKPPYGGQQRRDGKPGEARRDGRPHDGRPHDGRPQDGRPHGGAPRQDGKPGGAHDGNKPRHDGRPQGARADGSPGAQRNDGRPSGTPRNDRKPHGERKPRSQEEIDLAKAYALRAQTEKAERARLEREAQERAREKKERKAKLAALLEGKSHNAADADVPRHFPHGDKIRRVYVTAEQLTRLNRGELGVVQHLGRYLLVDGEVARQAAAIAPESLVLLPDPNAPADDDIPPDLVW